MDEEDEARLIAARVEAALRELPEQQRSVFLAISQDGLSYQALAEELETTAEAVEAAFAAALVALAEAADR